MELAALETVEEAYKTALDDIEKRKNTLWFHLVIVLVWTSPMLVRHDCFHIKDPGVGRKAWVFLQRRKSFECDETVIVVSVMRQLAHLQLKEDEALHNYCIRVEELPTRLEHSGEHLSEPFLNAIVRLYSIVNQSNLNPLWCRRALILLPASLSFEQGYWTMMKTATPREGVDDFDSPMAMTSKKTRPKHMPSSKYNAVPNSSSGQLTCYCCGMENHTKTECYIEK